MGGHPFVRLKKPLLIYLGPVLRQCVVTTWELINKGGDGVNNILSSLSFKQIKNLKLFVGHDMNQNRYSLLWKQVLLQLRHRGRGGGQVREGHDVLQGDVRLGAGVRHLGVSGRPAQFGMRGSAQDLDHDGLLGGAEGLHRLVVGGFGEVFAIHLRERAERKRSATC